MRRVVLSVVGVVGAACVARPPTPRSPGRTGGWPRTWTRIGGRAWPRSGSTGAAGGGSGSSTLRSRTRRSRAGGRSGRRRGGGSSTRTSCAASRSARRRAGCCGGPGTTEGRDPAWAPSGREIVTASYDEEDRALVRMRLDGTVVRRLPLPQLPGGAMYPEWSPDGRWIVFQESRPRATLIWRMRPDGTGLEQLGEGRNPTWSPDGRSIAYATWADVWVMRADGSGKREVLHSRVRDTDIRGVTWSPDGRRIAVSTFRYGFGIARPYRLPDGARGRRARDGPPALGHAVPVDGLAAAVRRGGPRRRPSRPPPPRRPIAGPARTGGSTFGRPPGASSVRSAARPPAPPPRGSRRSWRASICGGYGQWAPSGRRLPIPRLASSRGSIARVGASAAGSPSATTARRAAPDGLAASSREAWLPQVDWCPRPGPGSTGMAAMSRRGRRRRAGAAGARRASLERDGPSGRACSSPRRATRRERRTLLRLGTGADRRWKVGHPATRAHRRPGRPAHPAMRPDELRSPAP